MKLLYVSGGHPLQETDDCLMWDKLDIEWDSTGYYANTYRPGDLPYIKRYITSKYINELQLQNQDIYAENKPYTSLGNKNFDFAYKHISNRWIFTSQFIEPYDIIFFNHNIDNVVNNWEVIKHKKVVLKTFGMHLEHNEPIINQYRQKGLLVIRNSPNEYLRYKSYGGHDAIIRGSVVQDENEISGWVGGKQQIITFANNLNDPNNHNIIRRLYYTTTRNKMPNNMFLLYGGGNHDEPLCQQYLPHIQKIYQLQNSRVSFCIGTNNASSTYSFVEAWVMGLPQVVFGRPMWPGKTYEIDKLLQHGVDGFIANTTNEAIEYLQLLLSDYKLAKKMSKEARKRSIPIFGRKVLSQQWKRFFQTIGV